MKVSIPFLLFTGKAAIDIEVPDDTERRLAFIELAIMRRADLRGADLRDADLAGANLRDADLRRANLRGADLRDADLRGAHLRGANLRDADLRRAHLRGADLRCANLRGANLRDADLRRANLRGANLWGANLGGADLRGADLRDAKNAHLAWAQTLIVPQEGEIIGWKKAGVAIVKLRVPPEARRSNATGRKCRAEFVEVLEVHGAEVGVTEAHGPTTEYRPGETVHGDGWDEDRWNECSNGIHFFLTREEAEAWT